MDNCKNVEISGLTHLNSPRNHISLDGCSQVSISGVNLIAPKDSPNTDGIDIAVSNQVYIHDSYIGTGNQTISLYKN